MSIPQGGPGQKAPFHSAHFDCYLWKLHSFMLLPLVFEGEVYQRVLVNIEPKCGRLCFGMP